MDAANALWRGVFALERWHFIDRGGRPMVGVVDERSYVFAFTDASRARVYIAQQQLAPPGAERVQSLELDEALGCCVGLARHGVFGVLFNDGPMGFFAPLHQLGAMPRPDPTVG